MRSRILGAFWAWGLVALSKTWRTSAEGLERLDNHLENGPPVIAVFWHGHYLTLFPFLRGRRACVFTSLSDRGSVLASLAEHLGMTAVQIPDRGGKRSFAMMAEALKDGASAAIAVDGPLGPYHQVHGGAIRLASQLGHVLLPVAAAADRRTTLHRWDRLQLPYPFASMAFVAGNDIRVPVDLDEAGIDRWADNVHQHLDATSARAQEKLRRRS